MPVAVTYPGVYIQELPSAVHPITGVATSIAAFIGWANQGPTTPQLLLSWSEYVRIYGGLIAGYPAGYATLGYAVSQFFANGGNQAYVIRLTDAGLNPSTVAAATTIMAAAASGTGSITFAAATQGVSNPGAWAKNYGIVIKNQLTGGNPNGRFRLQVLYNPSWPNTVPVVVESFENLSPTTPDPQGRYVGDILKTQSNYVMATANTLTVPPSDNATNATTGQPTTGMQQPQNLGSGTGAAAGNDGAQLSPSSPGTQGPFENALLPASGTGGAYQLARVDLFNLLCVPGLMDPSTISLLEAFCVTHRAFMIVDCNVNDTLTSLENGPNNSITGTPGTNAAFYFPWINGPDPLNQGSTGPFPPCGYVAGIYAATDGSRGVWKAPAGTAASLTGVIGPYVTLNDADNGILNPLAVNCIRNFSAYGTVVWGARTLQGNDEIGSQWKYVPVKRLALFIEESLYRGTQWAVFEPNDEPLWAALRLNIGSFMQTLFRQGAFQGQTPQDAYFVKCDDETTTQADINLGVVNVIVGFAPLLPAEFVVIQIQQMAGQTGS